MYVKIDEVESVLQASKEKSQSTPIESRLEATATATATATTHV